MNEINGIYRSRRRFDDVPRFTKTGLWEGRKQEFTLFRCVLSDQSRRWYISIIPQDQKPGTNKDIDFYLCPATGNANEVPHGCLWQLAREGSSLDPPPTVEWRSSQNCHDQGNLTDQRSNDEYDDMVDDTNYDDALMEDEVQQ